MLIRQKPLQLKTFTKYIEQMFKKAKLHLDTIKSNHKVIQLLMGFIYSMIHNPAHYCFPLYEISFLDYSNETCA